MLVIEEIRLLSLLKRAFHVGNLIPDGLQSVFFSDKTITIVSLSENKHDRYYIFYPKKNLVFQLNCHERFGKLKVISVKVRVVSL